MVVVVTMADAAVVAEFEEKNCMQVVEDYRIDDQSTAVAVAAVVVDMAAVR
jgi:hypothetical protein